MKFGKDFKKQKVPEWTEAYMDYNGLKRILREIFRLKQSKEPPTPSRASWQRSTLYSAFSGLNLQANNVQKSTGDIEDQVVAVNAMQQGRTRKLYDTKFLMSAEEGGENEVMFFKKLDDELNKVNKFYKDKVEEVIREATVLNKQMDALIALRIKVEKPDINETSSERTDVVSMGAVGVTSPSRERLAGTQDNANGSDFKEEVEANKYQAAQLEVLDHVKINNTIESLSTIKGVLNDSKGKEFKFNKEELRKAEERLKLVFIEFYCKLRFLKHYSFMNLSAFSKIMKKYEKIASRSASRSYMKIVDSSYLGSSDEVTRLLNRVEDAFIKYFSKFNRREGMKSLRPQRKREKHRVTFFSGFFSGCSIALLVAVILLIQARKVLDKEERALYMGNIFPLYSFYAYIILHMLLYSSCIYFWKRYRVNYVFIFGFKQGTELGYREIFLLSTGLAVLVLSTFLLHLHFKMDSRTQGYEAYVEMIPLGLVSVVLLITFCPFNIIYSSSRFFLIRCFFRCICAPLYTVTLADFFLADHLTSEVQAMRSFEFYTCYYGWGRFSKEQNKCHSLDIYNVFYFIIAIVPYWIRFLQCLRRLFEDKDLMHVYNGFRYFLTIVAVAIRTAFELKKGTTWKVLDIILRFAWLQLVLKFNVSSLRGIAITSLFSCLEILRRGIWSFFRLENEHVNNVGKFRAFKSVPLPFSYLDDEENSDKYD